MTNQDTRQKPTVGSRWDGYAFLPKNDWSFATRDAYVREDLESCRRFCEEQDGVRIEIVCIAPCDPPVIPGIETESSDGQWFTAHGRISAVRV